MKRLRVRVVPRASDERVEVLPDGSFKIRVTAPPERGKANQRALELLAEHLDLPASLLTIVSGQTGRHKIVQLPE